MTDYVKDKIEETLSAPKLAAEYKPLEEAECHTCAIAADLKKQKIINDDLIKHDLIKVEKIKEELVIQDLVKEEKLKEERLAQLKEKIAEEQRLE